jgi:hypothetical protein
MYGAGIAVLAALTVLIFGVEMPAALSVVVQVLWIALIFVVCLFGARDIRRAKLDDRGRPRAKDGPGLPRGLEGFDARREADKGQMPGGPRAF